MLKAINLATRQIHVLDYPETVAAARVVYLEECRAACVARGKDPVYWDKELPGARAEAERVKADPEMITWIRNHYTRPGQPSLADRIMAKPYGEKTVSF